MGGRRVACLILVAITAFGCGDDGGGSAAGATATSSPAERPAAQYVRETTRLFDQVIAARQEWEASSGPAALRTASEQLLERERALLEHLRATTPPDEVRDQHARLLERVAPLPSKLERLLESRRLDTNELDNQVGRLSGVENVVLELYRFG